MKPEKAFLGLCCMILFSLFGVALTSNPALALDVTVCASGCNYTSIGPAITAVSAAGGGTVTVTDSRVYSACITMKDGVNVVSSDGQTPTINCTSSGGISTVTFNGPISCELDGFNITHTERKGAGIFLNNTGGTELVTISNCSIHDIFRSAGIRMDGDVVCTITGNTIYDCYEAGIATAVDLGGGGGTDDQLTSGSDVTIKGNTIGDSTNPNGKAGIFLDGSGSNITVTIGGSGDDSNVISYSTEAGIRLEHIDQVSIENNEICNNSEAGILLIDVSTVSPHIKNNDIHDHANEAGINIGGASSVTITGDDYNSLIHDNYAGIAFYVSRNTRLSGSASSQPVTITGNDIYSNTKAGIAVIDNVTGTITIDNNKIHQNTQAGIAFFNACTAVITDNEIYTHTGAAGIFTGDWSGTPPEAGTGFHRANGPATLTIKRNKIHGNRAGIRVDHASGTINNNLVYGNSRAGIRFSGNDISPYAPFSASWGITEIMNNTVADNGSYVEEFSENRGGGIVYDDIDGIHTYFYDHPVGATQNAITIKNNILANNQMAGIKFCADNPAATPSRSHNLFYRNVEGICDTGGGVDCGRMCRSITLGKCDGLNVNCCDQDSWVNAEAPFPGDWATGEICGQDPLFNADYTLQGGSPAIGAGSDNNDMGAYGGADPIIW